MDSTIYLQTKEGNGYLYDNRHSCMINCHPVIQTMFELSQHNNDTTELFRQMILNITIQNINSLNQMDYLQILTWNNT